MRFPSILARVGRQALILPPVLIGAAVLFAVVARRNTPQQQAIPEASRPLRVITVTRTAVVPRVLGFGTARPGDIWSAVAEVKGRITETHQELKAGAIIRQGETVVRIDPAEYDLQIARLKAEIAQVEAQQAELDAKEGNYKAALAIEQEALRVAKRELKRIGDLRASNAVAEVEFDQTSRAVLSQQQTLQSLRSSLNVLPAQRKAMAANLDAKRAALGQAQLDLERTVIKTPFDCRLSDVALQRGQFVAAGETLFEAYGAAVTEVEAQMPIDQLRKLLTPSDGPLDLSRDAMQTIRTVFNVEALVRLRTGDFVVQWVGRFDRIREELDLQTRTLRVVIAVDRPYENVVPGQRPPLSPGMFCEVELRGASRPDRIVVPRTSLRDNVVYLVNRENRLEPRPVNVEFSQGGFSVIAEGLSGGETLVVSDPTPAIAGMLVEPLLDTEVQANLEAEARGEGEMR
jgi:RND family efflux transporter MFP subunit